MGDIYDPKLVAHVICSVMHSDAVDGAFYVSFTPQMPRGRNVFRAMFRTDLSKEAWGAILSSGKPFAACLTSPSLSEFKQAINVPIFNSPEELIRAMSAQMKYYGQKRSSGKEDFAPVRANVEAARNWMLSRTGDIGEESLELLEIFGITTAPSMVATDETQAVAAARKIRYPVVMKVISPDALHQSDAGGVVVGVADSDAVITSFRRIRDNLELYHTGARFDGVRIQQMAGDGYDLFIGGKQDEAFGPVVFFGMGGIFVELFRDTGNVICPATHVEVRSRRQRLKIFSMIKGMRGKLPGDIDLFVDTVVRVSHLLSIHPRIHELDINPMRIFSTGGIALDARMRII